MLRGFIATAAVVLTAAMAPGAAAAQPKALFNGAFELHGTNGYRVEGVVASDGTVGYLALIVSRGSGEAMYVARGEGTATTVDIDLGQLGRVDVEVRPTGIDETIRGGCGGKGKPTTIPGNEFVGTIEFHGEEGFAEAAATSTPLLVEPLLRLVCGGTSVESGDSVDGVLIHAKAPGGPSVVVQQNHRGAPVYYRAKEHEKEGNVAVTRTVGGHLGSDALHYDPSLASASFSAASPFSGAATYVERTPPRRGRPGSGIWRGSLAVDFPGDPGARLAGPGFKASIVHADRTETHE